MTKFCSHHIRLMDVHQGTCKNISFSFLQVYDFTGKEMEVEHSAGTWGHQPGVKTTGWITIYEASFRKVRRPWIILPLLKLFVNIGWTYNIY